MEKKHNIIYKTTNIVNNKIYIGLHSTNNLKDGYKGSGKILKEAIKKYGSDKFETIILYDFKTRLEARQMEEEIVDTNFISRKDTYNLIEGGGGAGDQYGEKNHMYGKLPVNSKKVIAIHKDGNIIKANSIKELEDLIQINRINIRNLLQKGIRGKKGWIVIEDNNQTDLELKKNNQIKYVGKHSARLND